MTLKLKAIAQIGGYKIYPHQGKFILAANGMIFERDLPTKQAAIDKAKHFLRAQASATAELSTWSGK